MLSEFSERFMRMRQDKGMTQQKAAEILGVTAQAVSKWETHQSLPDVEMLRSIANCFNCSTDYLLGHRTSNSSQLDLESVERQSEIENAIQKDIITVEIGTDLISMLMEENKNHYTIIHDMRVRLASSYGIMITIIRLRDNPLLDSAEYRILLHETQVIASGTSHYPQFFYTNVAPDPAQDFFTFIDHGNWCPKKENIPTDETEYSAMQVIIAHLSELILKNYDKILNRQLTYNMVALVQKRYPASIDGIVPEIVSYRRIQDTIAALIQKKIPVNRLDYIIAYLEDHSTLTEKDIDVLDVIFSKQI